jgi:hypothetical protein
VEVSFIGGGNQSTGENHIGYSRSSSGTLSETITKLKLFKI